MSRFTVAPIEHQPPSARGASSVSATLASFVTASGTVNEENLSEEGLSRSTFSSGVMTELGVIAPGVTPTTFASPFVGIWSQLVLDGGATPVTIGGIPATTAGQWIRCRFFANLSSIVVPVPGVGTNDFIIGFRLAATVGGVVTKIPASTWKRIRFAGPGVFTNFLPDGCGGSGCVRIETWAENPGYTDVEAQCLFSSPAIVSLTVENATLTVDRFDAVGTL
jgi:hypothetical protein